MHATELFDKTIGPAHKWRINNRVNNRGQTTVFSPARQM